MASDNTGWQDETIEIMNEDSYDACILWNSKRPTGTDSTLKQLREIIKEDGSFYFYYNQGGNINYRAKIIDFVENQIQLSSSNWQSKYTSILDYNEDITLYRDSNKSASIVFLAESIEEIKPISIDKFSFYKSSRPTQDNISPIQEEPQEIEIIEYKSKHLTMQHPLNQIFYGSPAQKNLSYNKLCFKYH
ncbi:MAG: hypothetical protein IPG85_09570 [Bacteroidetes bacterium]|nr:hypothetical protein [Bacteroidota bacterium]